MRLISEVSSEKLRGGFYTPENIADFMLKWALSDKEDAAIFEPSCGDGVFLDALKKGNFKYKSMLGLELDEVEAKKAAKIKPPKTQVICEDFYAFYSKNKRFDVIVGNPPYIRYQFFNKQQKHMASVIFDEAGLKYSKLTNAWVSFVVGSSLMLAPNGRIAFVLPAEILQVSYAKQLREFLSHYYNKINIISFEKLVFPHIQQEVVLLFCEKDGTNDHSIEHLELHDASNLINLDIKKLNRPKKRIDFRTNKWTFYFLDQDEIDLIESVKERGVVSRLGNYADVEVGITTGSNSFFTVPHSIVEKYNLEDFAKPLVGRSVQVPSSVFTVGDWKDNIEKQARAYVLDLPSKEKLHKRKHEGALSYLRLGEELKINKGYKTGIRAEWQIIPSLRKSDALFIRRNNLYPKLVINEAGAYTTDTMHRVTPKSTTNLRALTASYYNSLSLAFSEISGRSHGGGVLELMPSEVEDILLPYNLNNSELLPYIDDSLRSKIEMKKLLARTDRKILGENLGFTEKEIRMFNRIWLKLQRRRLYRD
jgi:adenine-specific DNA-methyltransferase